MKTKMLNTYTLSEETKTGLKCFIELKRETREALVDWLNHREPPYIFTTKEIAVVSDKTGENVETIAEAASSILSLFSHFGDYEDNIRDLVADISSMGIITIPGEMNEYEKVFEKCVPLIKKITLSRKERETQGNGAPTLGMTSMSVAVKPVFFARFDCDCDDIAKYSPQFNGFTAVAQVELRNSANENFAFQLNERDLNILIGELLALQKELSVTREHLKTK